MNIDSSNLLSMLSTGEGVDTIQQLLPSEGTETTEFSEALMQRIQQLQSVNPTARDSKNITVDGLVNGNQLHEIADFISNNEAVNNISSLSGKGLPQDGKGIEKDINLENTLETLANVLNTIEDKGVGDIPSQIEVSVELVKSIKQALPQQLELADKFDQIVDQFDRLNGQDVDSELDTVKQLDEILGSLQQAGKLLEKGSSDDPELLVKEAQLSDAPQDRKKIENTIEQLVLDITAIKEDIASRTTEAVNVQQESEPFLPQAEENTEHFVNSELGNQLNDTNIKKIAKKENYKEQNVPALSEEALELDKEIASLVATLNEPKAIEKGANPILFQEMRAGLHRENLSLKQLAEQRNIEPSNIEVDEDSLQAEQSIVKNKQNEMSSLLMAKQNEKMNILESKAPELTMERVLPKFAMDIASLNRAVPAENKTEIAPMTKHFAHPEWNKEMGERVIWMHKQAIPSAELRLNPGHLGPITIKIDMTQDQATVAFTAQHAAVKEAIDAALPRLREMFSAQQLNLAEVSVSQEEAGQKQHRSFSQMGSDARKGDKEANEALDNEFTEKPMDIAGEIEAGRAISSQGVLSIFA